MPEWCVWQEPEGEWGGSVLKYVTDPSPFGDEPDVPLWRALKATSTS